MKTVMITGGNSGLGYETARRIAANKDYAVILACRNSRKAEKAQQDIIRDTDNPDISVQMLDTSSLASVRQCVQDLKKEHVHLNVLINNAGISAMHKGTTPEGFELVFATNYLGHYLLTMELLDSMDPEAQILNVTSDMHNPPGGIVWKGADYCAYQAQNDRRRYSYSKLCNILFTYKLAEELKKHNSRIRVNCFNPGYMADTGFAGSHGGSARTEMVKVMMPDRYGTLEDSSKALTELVTGESFTMNNGIYYDRQYGIGTSSDLSHDQKVQDELWEKSQGYTGIDAEEILKNLPEL